MRRFTIATFAAAFTLIAGHPASPALAQGQPNFPGQSPPAMPDTSVSVEFKGGTVLQYIEALKKSGKAVNVVPSERAGKQQLSSISLSQVPVGVAVYAIQAAASSAGGAWRIDQIIPPGPRILGTTEAYAVDFFALGKRGEEVGVESYSLQKILRPDGKAGGVDAKVILTAIETGLKLQNEGMEQPPDLQFHADSGLLFIRGTSAEVRLVGSVVSRMSEDAGRRATASERKAREDAMRGLAVREAGLQVQLREMEFRDAVRSLEEAKQLSEKGMVGAGELSRIEVEVARARYNFERAKLGLERAQLSSVDPEQLSPPPTPDSAPSARGEEAPAESPRIPERSTKRPNPK